MGCVLLQVTVAVYRLCVSEAADSVLLLQLLCAQQLKWPACSCWIIEKRNTIFHIYVQYKAGCVGARDDRSRFKTGLLNNTSVRSWYDCDIVKTGGHAKLRADCSYDYSWWKDWQFLLSATGTGTVNNLTEIREVNLDGNCTCSSAKMNFAS